MKGNSISTGKAIFGVILVFVVLDVILKIMGVGEDPKCASSGCDETVAFEGDYCSLHDYKNDSDTKHSYESSSSSSSYTSGSHTTSNNSNNSYTSGSHATSSSPTSSYKPSSSSNHYNSSSYNDSYDDGYDDVYMDDDYDWDRYYEDDDYAEGVDDALDDMEDGDW